jgi:hypothetical protein
MSIGKRTGQLSLAILVLSLSASAATAANINASSCSSSAVQSAVNAATTGDTVIVPAGACSYSSTVNVPNGKNITIQGAGINVTTISSAGGQVVVFNLNDTASRITGFTLNNAQISIGGNETGAQGSNDWRIDHNRFVGPSTGAPGYTFILIRCSLDAANPGRHCRGLVDNNQFVNGQVGPFGFKTTSDLHQTWTRATALGGADTIFIEDNTFEDTSGNLTQPVDTNYGGRFVFRFNTLTNMAPHVHSLQGYRGSRAWEIYKNTIKGAGWTTGFMRGGVGVVWGNTIATGLGPWVLDNVRSFNTGYDYGSCDGTSTADGNTAAWQGYPCRDQIGRGQDLCLSKPSSTAATASGWCAQAHEPTYFFLNRTGNSITPIDTSGRGRSSTLHVLANRDFFNEVADSTGASGVGAGPIGSRPAACTPGVAYWATNEGSWNTKMAANTSGRLYKCTATNTWTLYYTPYTYPHPRQGSAEGGGGSGSTPAPPPSPPTNLIIR